MKRPLKSIKKRRAYNIQWGKTNKEQRNAINRKSAAKNKNKKSLYNRQFRLDGLKQFTLGIRKRAIEKRCSICKLIKPASNFYLSNTNADGLHGWCKKCSDKRTVENGRKRLFGVSPEQFNTLLIKQNKSCAICKTNTSGKKDFNLDHNHNTGEIRGILCFKCNLMIGLCGDNIRLLEQAIKYLKK